MGYAERTRRPPKTLTDDEQRRILRVTGQVAETFRDHVIISFALGTALREHEIVALNVGDVRDREGKIRRRFPLRKWKGRKGRRPAIHIVQEAILPDSLYFKIEKLLRWKENEGESLDAEAPLFISKRDGRLSDRTVRHMFAVWQERAGFERRFTFHELRHTCLSNLYRTTKDVRLVQKVARHASIFSTMIYTHPSDEDILRAMRANAC